jgi:hypothetical protein
MEYAFEHIDGPWRGHWQHRDVSGFRDEAHAREWAQRAGLVFRGTFRAPDYSNAPGSASWCETYGDSR